MITKLSYDKNSRDLKDGIFPRLIIMSIVKILLHDIQDN